MENRTPFINRMITLIEAIGETFNLWLKATRFIFCKPFEFRNVIRQLEVLGFDSVGFAIMMGLFVGMVMSVQFAIGLQKFGGIEYTGRVIALSFIRELAPTLTAVVVGSRMSAGIASEIGSMAVTEQVDAIIALGADPIKKLVTPRLIAATIIMPILNLLVLVIGVFGAMMICQVEFGLPSSFFLQTSIESVHMSDFLSGTLKSPIFGMIIAICGSYFGLVTRGGTEGVGRSTTMTVTVTSITILTADFILTKLFILIFN